jgi:hypothetical protein
MSESESDAEQTNRLNLLRVSESRAGDEITVVSTGGLVSGREFDAYVDDDGTVRQENGAAFNAANYEVSE